MSGIKKLTAPPIIEPDDDGITVRFTSGDKIASYSMSWHFFTLALHEAKDIFASGEAAHRARVVEFSRGRPG